MTDETTPEQFVDLIKAQCPIGFNQFYEKYSSSLYGICLYALKSDALAEEILELSFLNIYSQIDSYQTAKLKFHCWMLTVLVKTVKDYYNSKGIEYCFTIEKFPYFTCTPLMQPPLSLSIKGIKI